MSSPEYKLTGFDQNGKLIKKVDYCDFEEGNYVSITLDTGEILKQKM